MGTTISRTPIPQVHGNGKCVPKSGSGEWQVESPGLNIECWQCIYKESTTTSSSWMTAVWDCSSVETPTKISQTRKPASLFRYIPQTCCLVLLSIMNILPYSAVYNQLAGFPGCWCVSIRAHCPTQIPAFLYMCHFSSPVPPPQTPQLANFTSCMLQSKNFRLFGHFELIFI